MNKTIANHLIKKYYMYSSHHNKSHNKNNYVTNTFP